MGTNCEIPIFVTTTPTTTTTTTNNFPQICPASINICKNGVCIIQNNTLRCVCPEGYYGDLCEYTSMLNFISY
jgi:hypothetical protein